MDIYIVSDWSRQGQSGLAQETLPDVGCHEGSRVLFTTLAFLW